MFIDMPEIERLGGRERNPDIAHALRILELNGLVRDWKPIETAPKDASIIVGGPETDGAEAYWLAGANGSGVWRCMDGRNNALTFFMPGAITKWMPLPAAPV